MVVVGGVKGGGGRSIAERGGALISKVVFPAVTSHRKTAQEVESDRDAEMRSPEEVGGLMGRMDGGMG